MTDTTYNGWTNFETWLANVWLSETDFAGELESQRNLTLCDVAQQVESMIEVMTEETRDASHGLGADLLSAAIDAVNVTELARAYFSDLKTEG